MNIFEQISAFLQQGNAHNVKELVNKAISEGYSAVEVLDEGLMAGMSIVGEKFKNNNVYVPEVLLASRAMNTGMELLKPMFLPTEIKQKGTAVLGTVRGDLHDIGKNLIKIMFESKGIMVIDLGVNVYAESFVETAVRENAQIIACSALLTTTMNEMKTVVSLAKQKGLRDKIKIMVGGAPVTQIYCKSIGADYYAPDAASASDIALQICSA